MTEEDDVLDLLGAAARAERDREPDPVWDELAHGERGAEDPALAAASEGDAEHAELVAAFTPLSDEKQGAIAAAVTRELGAVEQPAEERSEDRGPFGASRSERSKVVSIGWVAAGVAALAAIALLAILPGEPAALTRYDATLIGGVSELRGAEPASGEVPRFLATSRVELRLRPAERVTGDVEVSAWVEDPSGERTVWPVSFERADGGAMRVIGTADALFDLPAGSYTLVLALARADAAGPSQELRVPIVLEEATR